MFKRDQVWARGLFAGRRNKRLDLKRLFSSSGSGGGKTGEPGPQDAGEPGNGWDPYEVWHSRVKKNDGTAPAGDNNGTNDTVPESI